MWSTYSRDVHHLFTKNLPLCLCEQGLELNGHRELIDILRSTKVDPKIRLVPVSIKSDRPGKSAEVMIRLLRRNHLGLNKSWFAHPNEIINEINSGIKHFIFIDDFLGTGDQFSDMIKLHGLSLYFKKAHFTYAPLVAHSTGFSRLQLDYPEITVVAAEYLNDNSSVFASAFNDGYNTPESAKAFYDNFIEKKGFNNLLPEKQYGHGNLALAYGFEHSIPDNNLNIIWDTINGWKPLIKR